MSDLTQFDRQSANRIARVVRAVEGEPQQAKPLTFDRVDTPRERKQFRVVTITSDWNKDETKTVTFYNQTATPNTVSATNLLFDVAGPDTSGPSTTKTCVIGKDGTAWYFVNADDSGEIFRIATYSGAWSINSSKTVAFDSGGTAVAQNLFCSLPLRNTPVKCAVAKEGDDWHLVEAGHLCYGSMDAGRLDGTALDDMGADAVVPGDGPQVLLNDLGCCRWVGLIVKEVIIDVRWEGGLVVEKKKIWALDFDEDPTPLTIISETSCE